MKKLQEVIDNKYEVYYSDRDGYLIHSRKSELDYELAELKALNGTATTDIVAIMPCLKDSGYVGMLTYFFGAHVDEAIGTAVEIIEDFESGNIKMQSYLDMDSLNELLAHLLEKHITIRIE